jgi:hypothetical protein
MVIGIEHERYDVRVISPRARMTNALRCCRGFQGDSAREEAAHGQAGDVRAHLRDRHLQVRAAWQRVNDMHSSDGHRALQLLANSSASP